MNPFQLLKRIFSSRQQPEPDPMKYLIAGLGNMHPDYDDTRHNIGFEVLQVLSERGNAQFKNDQLADICEIKFKGRTLILIKPSTYMNRSGKAVRYWMQKHKIEPEKLLIVVDDLNLPFGNLRIRAKGSEGGHNGLKSIIEILGHTEFARLRIGIGGDFHKTQQINYVLGKWSDEEREKLPGILQIAADAVQAFCFAGINNAMNEFNS